MAVAAVAAEATVAAAIAVGVAATAETVVVTAVAVAAGGAAVAATVAAAVGSGRGSGSGSSSAATIAMRVVSVVPQAILLSLPSIVTAPLLVLPSPEVRVKLLVDGNPETIDASPPAAFGKSPAVTVNTPPMLLSSGSGSGSIWYWQGWR